MTESRRKVVPVLFLLLGAAVMAVPFLVTVANSLKTFEQYISVPPQWLPNPVEWANYGEVLQREPLFWRFAMNSFVVAGLSVVGCLLTSSMVGFALARLRLPGRQALLAVALGTMALPTVITIVPSFVLYRQLGWLDTHAPLILPYSLGTAFGIFLMRQAFLTIPRELLEAATVDGANPWRAFWRTQLPLVRPQLATLGVFTFMASWGAVLEPTIYLTSEEKFTLPIGVISLQGQYMGNEQIVAAAALLSLVPMLIIFVAAQRYFIRGVVSSGLKG
ncbi:carbohydrate ABC transporter permease [Jiangella mangrovi]|uniref:Multiple sugar transport system permease protein n=1 Tax=Jiangella mangrovi TaxID=1524084 RepID=A0A7W9LLU1_9ACTN|nr:carbohydrate ABC transporter permease [Jiangella mangrovi]MBB5788575.1 multiple sugar transport system permease protein [Jiangella mangrovi]